MSSLVSRKNIAVILAGGSGSRFGAELPKQFLSLGGRMVIEYTVEVFEINNHIEEIAIVTHPEYIEMMTRVFFNERHPKVKKILRGGKNRYDSSLAAIEFYSDNDNLFFHDAVRPNLSQRIIDDCAAAINQYAAVDVAIPTTDTIIQVKDGLINGIPPRSLLWNGQTPQCFHRSLIRSAYRIALQDPGFITTDDCGVVFKYLPEVQIFVVPGEVQNMKITYPDDIHILEHFMIDLKKPLKSHF